MISVSRANLRRGIFGLLIYVLGCNERQNQPPISLERTTRIVLQLGTSNPATAIIEHRDSIRQIRRTIGKFSQPWTRQDTISGRVTRRATFLHDSLIIATLSQLMPDDLQGDHQAHWVLDSAGARYVSVAMYDEIVRIREYFEGLERKYH